MKVFIALASENLKKVIANAMMVNPNTVKQAQDSDGREVYEVDLASYEKVLPVLMHVTPRLKTGLKSLYIEHILNGTTLQIFVRKMGVVKAA